MKVREREIMKQKTDSLEEFNDLMQEVAELPEDKREKVCIFVQGFMAAGTRETTARK